MIHISFAEGVLRNREELDGKILTILDENQKRFGIACEYKDSVSSLFSAVIRESKEKYGFRSVVLIDEYDKPILDNIAEPKIAEEMRDGLKNLYSVIKGQDANIQYYRFEWEQFSQG